MKSSTEDILGKATAQRPVYIVDDDFNVRTSLVFFLATHNLVGNAFESGRAFLEQVPGLAPSPVLLDMQMPGMSGLELLAEFEQREIDCPVIVLTAHAAVDNAVQAMKLGALDFLEKPIDGDLTMAALNRAFALLDENQDHLSARASARGRLASLTARQARVMEGLMRGLSNKQVALDLSLSPRTVEMHRATALAKLGVKTIAEAVGLCGAVNRVQSRPGPLRHGSRESMREDNCSK